MEIALIKNKFISGEIVTLGAINYGLFIFISINKKMII